MKNFLKPFTKNIFIKNFPKFNFARLNTAKKEIFKPSLNVIDQKKPIEEQFESKVEIPKEVSNLNAIIDKLYKQGKLYKLTVTKHSIPNDINECYDFLLQNINSLRVTDYDKLIRSLVYFNKNEEKYHVFFQKYLQLTKSYEGPSLVLYALAKLELNNQKILKDALNKLSKTKSLEKASKDYIVPLIWATSELNINLFEQLEPFIVNNIDSFNEYELSIIFRTYSKHSQYNYAILEKIIQKLIDITEEMNLRYIVITTKCLAELKIRNVDLIESLKKRIETIISNTTLKQMKKQNSDDFNSIDVDSIVQILSNLVKLEIIEFEELIKYEQLIFEIIDYHKEINKETMLSLLMAHSSLINSLYYKLEKTKGTSSVKLYRSFR